MDGFIHRQAAHAQQPSGLLAALRIFRSILDRIARLVQVTEQEQRDAGIYLRDQRYKS
jgi:hypothetical protein